MIPKKIHLSWKTKDLLDSDSVLVTEGVKRLKELNPDWELEKRKFYAESGLKHWSGDW